MSVPAESSPRGWWPRQDVPSTVAAFIAFVVAVLVVFLFIDGLEPRFLWGGSVLALATLGLARRFWVAWLFLVFVAAGDILIALARGPAWWSLIFNGVMLGLLVAGSTRRYASRGRPRLRRRL